MNIITRYLSARALAFHVLVSAAFLQAGLSCPAAEVILDNTSPSGVTFTGAWTASTATSGYYGSNYHHDGNTAKGTKNVRYTPNIPYTGYYEVFGRWTAASNRAASVPIDISGAAGVEGVSVNQKLNNGQWVSLGNYRFQAGAAGNVVISNAGTSGYVIADAFRFTRSKPSPFTISCSGEAGSGYASFMPKLAAAGICGLRSFPLWNAVEPTNNNYTYTTADAMLASAEANGVELNGKFAMSAAWAAATQKTFPMSNLAEWSEYVQTMANRYQGRIRYWEVWNEPNAAAFNDGGHTAADYATLLIRAYDAAKAADPECKVGITVANFDLRYIIQVLQAMAAQSGINKFDFIAVHPYELLERINGKDGEIYYLSMVDSIRKLLAVYAPGKANAPIWFTELGAYLGGSIQGATVTEQEVASLLVKAYVLGMVQGVESIQWFEVKDAGGSQNWGLLNDDLSERAAYKAYKAMTAQFGPFPTYKGWVSLAGGGAGMGFVFEGKDSSAVMAAWMPKGLTGQTNFASNVQVADLLGNITTLPAGQALALSSSPVFVVGVPPAVVTQAQANLSLPYPWGSTSVNSNLAKIDLGPVNADSGVVQDRAYTTEPYTFSDGAAGQQVNLPGYTHAAYFSVDPSFADFNTSDVYVRVTARRITTGTSVCGMKVLYQKKNGTSNYTSAGVWWGLANHLSSQSYTFHLTNAMFVHSWGYGLWLQFDNSIPFAIQKVEVSKVPF